MAVVEFRFLLWCDMRISIFIRYFNDPPLLLRAGERSADSCYYTSLMTCPFGKSLIRNGIHNIKKL